MIHQVVAKFSAGIGEPVGELGGGRVQQDPCGFQTRSTQKYNFRAKFNRSFGLGIDDPHSGSSSRLRIETYAVHGAEGPQRHSPGLFSHGQGRIQAAEVRTGDAATLARSAVVTGSASLMILRKDRSAADGQHALAAKVSRHLISNHLLDTVEFHRRQKLAVGQLRKSESLA